jgi:serine/threonine protein kinase
MNAADDVRLLAGRYQLCSVVGRGGMGTVWRARDELLDRDVAIKEIACPPYLSDAEQQAARRRALREAQLAARLRHPNVVGIHDIVEEAGRPWIVMELFQYRSLRDIVREDGPLPPAQAAQLGLEVLEALRAAHAEGIVHRDVKPANILVSPEGHAVLTDFGIARVAGSPALTSDMLVGSPSYIAPERAWGGQAGPAADLWGLGAALYAAVEGRAPFERKDALASLTAAVTDEPEPAIHARSLWPVINGLLRKDPDRRLGLAEAERMLRQAARDGEAQPRRRSLRALGALAATVAVTTAVASALALPVGESPGRSTAALAAGPGPSVSSSPGRASHARAPNAPSGAASPSRATFSPVAAASASRGPAKGRGAKAGNPPGGQDGLTDFAHSVSVPPDLLASPRQQHPHAKPGKQRHKPAHDASG